MQGTDPLLGEGWAPSRKADSTSTDSYWVYGHDAEFRFFSAARGDLTLELQAMPHSPPGASTQVAYLLLNDQMLDPLPFEPGMRDYEVTLPGELLEDGWNSVRMQFRHALRPSEIDESNQDTRPLAARFRRVLLRSALGRPFWPDRPERIGLSNTGESLADAAIEMPTDSVLDVFVPIEEGQQLVGSVDISFAGPTTSAEIHAVVELLDSSSASHELFSTLFTDEPASPRALQVDLSDWAGELVQIRIKVRGSANATVRWHGLGLSASNGRGTQEPGERLLAGSQGGGRLVRGGGQPASSPDIIIIMLDAARADAFRGPDFPPATPNVDALAREATHFTTAWAPSSWTGQTVPALFTGQSPDTVGAEVWGSRLPKAIPTLAEIMAEAGYFTALWSQHNIYRQNESLRRGFELFEDVRADVQEDRLLLPGADLIFLEDRPTFAMIHLMPPHSPYAPPEPFRGRWSSWYDGDFEVIPQSLIRLTNDPPEDKAEIEEIARYALARYHENVEFADHLVGRLVEMLEKADRYENTLIVLLSDHGEAFFEHGRFLHTTTLYEEFLRVPLFVKWPAHMSGNELVVEHPVTLLDLAPTLIDGLGIDRRPAVEYAGRSLIPLAFDGAAYERDLYAYSRGRVTFGGGEAPVYAYRSGPYKVIYSATLGTLELYNLDEDPDEQNDLAPVEPRRAGYLAQKAMMQKRDNVALLAQLGPQRIEALDKETLRQLRALGYIQ